MADLGPAPSRRTLLRTLSTMPVTALSYEAATGPDHPQVLSQPVAGQIVSLNRSGEGRRLSETRFHRALSFFDGFRRGPIGDHRDRLYMAGIVAQLGLSAHLLDIGFDDRWCARHIGLRVANALAYANGTGLGLIDLPTRRLTAVLTPYDRWNARCRWRGPEPDDGGFSDHEIDRLLGALLDRVGAVTEHREPVAWRSRASGGGKA